MFWPNNCSFLKNVHNSIRPKVTFRFAGDAVEIEFVSVVTMTPEATEDVLTQVITQCSRDVQLIALIYVYKDKSIGICTALLVDISITGIPSSERETCRRQWYRYRTSWA